MSLAISVSVFILLPKEFNKEEEKSSNISKSYSTDPAPHQTRNERKEVSERKGLVVAGSIRIDIIVISSHVYETF